MNYCPNLIDDRMDITINFATVELDEDALQAEVEQLLPFYQRREQGQRQG